MTKEWSNLPPNSEEMISVPIISRETTSKPSKVAHFPIKTV